MGRKEEASVRDRPFNSCPCPPPADRGLGTATNARTSDEKEATGHCQMDGERNCRGRRRVIFQPAGVYIGTSEWSELRRRKSRGEARRRKYVPACMERKRDGGIERGGCYALLQSASHCLCTSTSYPSLFLFDKKASVSAGRTALARTQWTTMRGFLKSAYKYDRTTHTCPFCSPARVTKTARRFSTSRPTTGSRIQ